MSDLWRIGLAQVLRAIAEMFDPMEVEIEVVGELPPPPEWPEGFTEWLHKKSERQGFELTPPGGGE